MTDKATLDDAREAFKLADEAESDNRAAAREDIRFARLSDQWPENIKQKRASENRPCLTINMLPKFQRQVMNDIRQNRPAIKVRPVDSHADIKTADVYTGLIRNIEQQSHADTVWDTAAEHAIAGGFGYARIAVEHAYDDTFDQDIRLKRVANQFSIYGDPYSTEADSCDWNSAFEVELVPEDQYNKRYKGAEKVSFDDADYKNLTAPWREGDEILVAGWWVREEVTRKILKLSDDTVVSEEDFTRKVEGLSQQDIATTMGLTVVGERDAPTYKVKYRLLSGAEVLKTEDWPGRYIPIIPVYGEDINLDGKRILKSLIRDAKDPQINFNYWRTAATELIALAPKAPFVGLVGQFDTDKNWLTANTDSHPFLEADNVAGGALPQRQAFAGIPAGALNQAMLANDDMKAVIGMYDASLGQKSNETSGKAILARQREGDVATFHFADNLARAIRHAGEIILDLIPKVYSGKRMLRILGEDGKAQTVRIGQKQPAQPMQAQQPMQQPQPGGMGQPGMPMMPGGMPGQAPQQAMDQAQPGQEPQISPEVFDLTVGKYDLVVQAGPSYTTRREETAAALTDIIRAMPAAAPVLAPTLFKALDIPGIEEITKKLEAAAEQSKPVDPAQAKMAEVQANLQAKQAEHQAGMQMKQAELQATAQHKTVEQQTNSQLKMAELEAEFALKQKAAEQEAQLKLQIATWDHELEVWKAGQQAALATQTATDQATLADKTADQAAERDIRTATEKHNKTPSDAKSIAAAVKEGLSSISLKVEMPRMKRTPVYGQDGRIAHAIDEPLVETQH